MLISETGPDLVQGRLTHAIQALTNLGGYDNMS